MTKKLLIVDDELISTKAFASRLTKRGFEVSHVTDGKAALTSIAAELPSLVILDVEMPDMSGFEVLGEIRKLHSAIDLPVIMVTGLQSAEDVTAALRAGANDYVTKPVEVEVAISRINTHLTLGDLHRANVARSELQAIHAMIVTYNHEINNPLAIALGNLSRLESKGDLTMVEPIRAALMRIAAITKQIQAIEDRGVSFEAYTDRTKMVKLTS